MPSVDMQQFLPANSTIRTTWNGDVTMKNYMGTRETLARTRGWVRTPGLRSLRRSRTAPADLPMNLYTDLARTTDYGEDDTFTLIPDSWYPQNSMEVNGMFTPVPMLTPDVNNSLLRTVLFNKAIADLPSKMNGNSFNLPLFIGELHKSVEMITDMAKSLAKFFESLRRGQKKFLTQREVDGLWMEYRYGWRLLVKDIVDCLIAVNDALSRGVLQKAKSTARSSSSGSEVYGQNYYLSDPQLRVVCDLQRNYEEHYETTITLFYKDDYPWTGTLQQFGISNPFLLGWEFVRLSFVVDWAINVGDYLSSIDAFLGKSFVKGCVSYKVTQKNLWQAINIRPWQYDRAVMSEVRTSVITQMSRNYRREPLSDFPKASLPTIHPNLNMNRALDAIALMKQAAVPRTRGYTVKIGNY